MSKPNKIAAPKPSACPFCNGVKVSRVLIASEKEVRGEIFTVKHYIWRCGSCGESVMRKEEVNEALRATVLAYQKAHELLTADDIRKGRVGRSWSQQMLADETRLGVATIKRLEGGGVIQTPHNDYAIREALQNGWEYDRVITVETTVVDTGWVPDDGDGEGWKTEGSEYSVKWEELAPC